MAILAVGGIAALIRPGAVDQHFSEYNGMKGIDDGYLRCGPHLFPFLQGISAWPDDIFPVFDVKISFFTVIFLHHCSITPGALCRAIWRRMIRSLYLYLQLM
jgi:hypothetical protein